MDRYQEEYARRLTDAASLADRVESGWLIGMDAATAHTPAIMSALAARARRGEIEGVKVQTLLDVYPLEFYADSTLNGKLNGVSWFAGGGARKAINAGFADFIPNYYRDIPKLIRANYSYDAYCVAVSPMDEHGYFSLGCVSSYSEAMIEKSKRIFIEVNTHQPRAVCGLQIHVSQVDGIVENNMPLPVLPAAQIDEVSRTIGGYIAELIPDGACIQLGIGAIPDATGMALKTKHDLGIHTEMFTDSMVELIACGAVNNSRKTFFRNRSVAAFTWGTKELYDYIDDNPMVELLPVGYVNDPGNIMKNENMVSVNTALEIDLTGQVCSETIAGKQYSGTGGAWDFAYGAFHAKNGRGIIALQSTAKSGTISRIVPRLTAGNIVTIPRNIVDIVVTEYGVARLRGKSVRQRVEELIAVAHPDFRQELRDQARKLEIW